MKRFNLIIAIVVCSIFSIHHAIAYDSRDVLVYKGDTITLKNWILPSYIDSQYPNRTVGKLYPELCAVADFVTTPMLECLPKITATWIEKEGQVYLSEIWPYLQEFEITDTTLQSKITSNSKKLKYLSQYLPSEDSVRARLERITGEKFTSDGLLPATWLSQTIIGGKDFVSWEYFLNPVLIVIDKGKIIDICAAQNKPKLYDNPQKIDAILTEINWPWNEIDSVVGRTSLLQFVPKRASDGKITIRAPFASPGDKKLNALYANLSEMIADKLNNIPRNEMNSSLYHFQRYTYQGNSLDRFIVIELDPANRTVNFSTAFYKSSW